MAYTVLIKNKKTGETSQTKMKLDWEEGSDYWWSEGNFGCDCNRSDVFMEGLGHKSWADIECCAIGENVYEVVWIKLDNGEIVYRDNE